MRIQCYGKYAIRCVKRQIHTFLNCQSDSLCKSGGSPVISKVIAQKHNVARILQGLFNDIPFLVSVYASVKGDKRLGKKKVKETIIYQEQIPEQVIEELEDGQKIQYFIWDALIKRLSNLHPELLLPIVKEVFGKEYAKEEEITFLSSEYVLDTLGKNKNQRLHSIYADLVYRIGKKDIYHLECQIKPNAEMVLRMYEYDVQIAFQHGVERQKDIKKIRLEMPRSVIMYLTHTRYTPDRENMEIILPNDEMWKYSIPILKVQNYSVEEIAEKELYFLIPLTCIRYYSKEEKKVRKNIEPSLTQFLGQCMIIISDAIKKKNLTGRSGRDILDCFQRGCHYLFVKDEETQKEVQQMLEPYFKLEREIWQEETEERLREEITRKVTEEVTERAKKQAIEDVIKKIIQSFKNCGVAEDKIKELLVAEYELLEAEAEEKMKLYFV